MLFYVYVYMHCPLCPLWRPPLLYPQAERLREEAQEREAAEERERILAERIRRGEDHEVVQVAVPAGTEPGQQFPMLHNGLQFMIACPPNVGPGELIQVRVPLPLP